MFIKVPWKGISVFYRYILSNIVLLLIPFVVTGFFLLNNSIEAINNETKSMYAYKLAQISSYLEDQFERMVTISYYISNNKLFKGSGIVAGSMDEIEILENLKNYKEQSRLADDTLYYVKGSRDVYNPYGKYYTMFISRIS